MNQTLLERSLRPRKFVALRLHLGQPLFERAGVLRERFAFGDERFPRAFHSRQFLVRARQLFTRTLTHGRDALV